LKSVSIILRRELRSYFATPIAYVFLIFFLFLLNLFAFTFGSLYESNQADLGPFFSFHPWLYLILIPAISMRFWAEERNSGSIELLLTLPVTLWDAVLGKFLAGWLFVAIALALTFPVWITINYLGSPDNGAIFAAYIGSFFMAGAYLAVGSFMSATTRSQIIAFVASFVVGLLLVAAGFPMVTDWFRDWAPLWLVDGLASLSIYTHFQNVIRGVLDLRDVLYFTLLGGFFLLASALVLDARKAQ
jgi:ABC-2 type transport system permease protein